MWDGVLELLDAIAGKGMQQVYCKNSGRKGSGKCRQAVITIPSEYRDRYLGRYVYWVAPEEMEELRRRVRSLEALRMFFQALLNQEQGRKMFTVVTETWNPVTGCHHNCVYCWARSLALTKLRNTPRYRDGFVRRLNTEEFRKRFKGGVVFVSDMGDLFGQWVPREWILRVLRHTARFRDTFFLYMTKNPRRYHEFIDQFPPNSILGATIETNRDDLILRGRGGRPISDAPPPSERYEAMKALDWPLKFISIEPILDFDLEEFAGWVRDISPFMVYVGYDNYNHRLPEPPLRKTEKLIARLSEFTLVVRKTIRPAWTETLPHLAKAGRAAQK